MEVPDLIHLEQNVNDRLGGLPSAQIDEALLPESNTWRPLAWIPVPQSKVRLLNDDASEANGLLHALRDGEGRILFPVHPLVERGLDRSCLVYSGQLAVSASYRTVFYKPDDGGPLESLIPSGQMMMIKLHLDDPLPGIVGDRRLTSDKVVKCVELSRVLPQLFRGQGGVRPPVEIIRERFGIVSGERGAIFRIMPASGLVPAFALISRDRMVPGGRPMLVSMVENLGWSSRDLAMNLAGWLAEPILGAVLVGFREGFALELHGQNTLVSFTPDFRVEEVYFRDLESVIFFPELRERHGLEPIDLNHLGPELFQEPRDPTRWFNRNVDDDVAGILLWILKVLERERLLDRQGVMLATRQIRDTARRLIAEFGLERTAWQGRWLPFSRSPYGSGFRRGHYYRTRFR